MKTFLYPFLFSSGLFAEKHNWHLWILKLGLCVKQQQKKLFYFQVLSLSVQRQCWSLQGVFGAVVMETYNNGTMLNGQCEAAQRGRGDFKNSTLPGMPYLCLLLTTVVMVWHFHHRRTSSEKISLKVSWFKLLLNCLSAFVHFHIFCTYVYLIIFYWFFSIFLHFYILVDRQLCIWQ